MARSVTWAISVVALALVPACGDDAAHYTTTTQVVQVERFGKDAQSATVVDLELKFVDCPGDGRRVIRTDGSFAKCSASIKEGDRLKTEVVSRWVSDRSVYRSEIVKLGECAVKQDPKEQANYEMVQVCADIQTSGQVVGVRCDRSRPSALLDKCPWFRRR